jgi:hypothetical protein
MGQDANVQNGDYGAATGARDKFTLAAIAENLHQLADYAIAK